MPIRDDSAGSYGTWNNDDLSWLDYLKANASDGGNALANLGRNLAQGFSPIGTSEQGNMALQVPPIVSGIADSYSRLAGTPSQPGNAYDLSGVPELDAPIQQDMSNVLLSLYGGNAVSGLTKPKGALGAGAMREGEGVSISGQHPNYKIMNDGSRIGHAYVREYPETIQLGNIALNKDFQGQGIMTDVQKMLAEKYQKPTVPDALLSANEYKRWQKNDPAAIADYVPYGTDSWQPKQYSDGYYAAQGSGVMPGSRAASGELFSDTGKPSILGSALATGGESQDIPPWLRF